MKIKQQRKNRPKTVMTQFRLSEKDRSKLEALAKKWDVKKVVAVRYLIRRVYGEIMLGSGNEEA